MTTRRERSASDATSHLRIVRGEPTAEEVAAVAAVVTAAAVPAGTARPEPPRHGRWSDPRHGHRRYWPVGPGGWQAAVR